MASPRLSHAVGDRSQHGSRLGNPQTRKPPGLDGSAWYLLRIHQALSHRLPASRSTALLGEAVQDLLSSASYRRLVPHGIAPAVWAASYLERPEAHPQH